MGKILAGNIGNLRPGWVVKPFPALNNLNTNIYS
jgi:hypothetical protein